MIWSPADTKLIFLSVSDQIVIRPAGATLISSTAAGGATPIRSGSPAVIRAGVRPQLTQAGQQIGQVRATLRPAGSPQVKSQVHIIQGPNGQLTVRGLQPGQQLLKLPDGRLQIVNIQQKPTVTQTSGAASASPGVQKIVIQPSGQLGAGGQKLIQIRPAGVATPQNVSNNVKAVKLIQSAGGTTQVVQAGTGGQIIKGHIVQQLGQVQQVGAIVQPIATPVVLSANSLAISNPSTGSTTTTLLQPVGTTPQKVVISASQLRTAGGPQLILANTTPTTVSTGHQQGLRQEVKQEPPAASPQSAVTVAATATAATATVTTANTGTPHKIILTTQPFTPKVSQQHVIAGTFIVIPKFPG